MIVRELLDMTVFRYDYETVVVLDSIMIANYKIILIEVQ